MNEKDISPELMACLEEFTHKMTGDLIDIFHAYWGLNPFADFNLSKRDCNQLKVTCYANAAWHFMEINLKALSLQSAKQFRVIMIETLDEIINEKGKENECN
jgi:hypothetical protein